MLTSAQVIVGSRHSRVGNLWCLCWSGTSLDSCNKCLLVGMGGCGNLQNHLHCIQVPLSRNVPRSWLMITTTCWPKPLNPFQHFWSISRMFHHFCTVETFLFVRKANGSCQILNMLLMLSSLEMISNDGFLIVKLPKVLFLATHLQRTSELSIRNLSFHCWNIHGLIKLHDLKQNVGFFGQSLSILKLVASKISLSLSSCMPFCTQELSLEFRVELMLMKWLHC